MSSINAIAGSPTQATALVTSGDSTATLLLQTNSTTALSIGSDQNANCTSTGAFRIPVGTSAQRPSSPVNGMVRYNTSSNRLEGYANSTWVAFI